MARERNAGEPCKAPRTWWTAIAVTMLAAGLAACTTPRRPTQTQPSYQVRRVIDGDTLEIVDAGGIRTRVRLRDVDAPELDKPGGPEAAAGPDGESRALRPRQVRTADSRRGAEIAPSLLPEALNQVGGGTIEWDFQE